MWISSDFLYVRECSDGELGTVTKRKYSSFHDALITSEGTQLPASCIDATLVKVTHNMRNVGALLDAMMMIEAEAIGPSAISVTLELQCVIYPT